MEGLYLVPTPDPIPAPWWIFETLDLVVFVLHLLFANVVVGGTLLALAERLRGADPANGEALSSPVFGKIPVSLALTINLGVAPLLFVQVLYGHLLYSSSVLMATYWLLVIPILMLAYYGAYVYTRSKPRSDALTVGAMALSALCLLYTAFMFVNNMTMALQPHTWARYLSERGGTLLNLSDPTVLPRYLHFVVAAVAVTGLFAALLWSRRQDAGPDSVAQRVTGGLRLFAGATAVQLAVGLWFLVALPGSVSGGMLGADALHTTVLCIGVGLGCAAIVTALLGRLRPTVLLLLATVAMMATNRALVRAAYLDGFFSPSSLELRPQLGVLAVFLAVFVAGVLVVVYMLRLAANPGGREVHR